MHPKHKKLLSLTAAALLLISASWFLSTRNDVDVAVPEANMKVAKPERHNVERPFHIINLSLPRTGTTSIAGLFDEFNAVHEFMVVETVSQLVAWHSDRLSDEELDEFLIARDEANPLDVDSASFFYLAQERLFELFPDAMYLFSVRDGVSWFVSFIRLIVEESKDDPAFNAWMDEYGQIFSPLFRIEYFTEPVDLRQDVGPMITDFADFWGGWTTRTLENLMAMPPEKRLVLRTSDISDTLDSLAEFAGISVSDLNLDNQHLNRGGDRIDVLGRLGEKRVKAAFLPWQEKVDALMKQLEEDTER